MKGQLGGLFNGEQQIGGFLDWEFKVIFSDSSEGKAKTYKFSKWKLTAPAYWLFVEPNDIIVRLYHDRGEAYWQGSGVINSKLEAVFDTLIHEEIQIIGEGILEGKEYQNANIR